VDLPCPGDEEYVQRVPVETSTVTGVGNPAAAGPVASDGPLTPSTKVTPAKKTYAVGKPNPGK
jgi:hypothetical protein